MNARLFAVGVAALIGATPAVAQVRGSMEFGAFGSVGSFDSKIGLDNGAGFGGRFGMFLTPRLSLEVDGVGMSASRATGFAGSNVNVGMIYGRALWAPVQWGRTSLLLGAGITHVDYEFFESYGFSALGGVKFGFSPSVALRVDGIADFLANSPHTNLGIRAGLSFYRSPSRLTNTMTVERTACGSTFWSKAASMSVSRRAGASFGQDATRRGAGVVNVQRTAPRRAPPVAERRPAGASTV